jgi:DNA-binding transcriptional regulator YiaG
MHLATLLYATTIEHDGRTYRVEVPALTAPQCGNCQALSIDDEADQQISAAFRRAAGLLAPEEIRQGCEKLALTQKQFANLLGVGEATVSRRETGANSATRHGPFSPRLPRQPGRSGTAAERFRDERGGRSCLVSVRQFAALSGRQGRQRNNE